MVFFLPKLNKFLCCIPLRIGCLIIGYFSLVLSLAIVGYISFTIYKVVEYVADHKDRPAAGHTVEELHATAIWLYISQSYLILVFLFCCAIHLMLLVGAHKNKSGLLRLYLTTGLILIALTTAVVVLTYVFFGFAASLPLLFWCVLLFYFIVVARSRSAEIEDEKNKPPLYYMMYDVRPPLGVEPSDQLLHE